MCVFVCFTLAQENPRKTRAEPRRHVSKPRFIHLQRRGQGSGNQRHQVQRLRPGHLTWMIWGYLYDICIMYIYITLQMICNRYN